MEPAATRAPGPDQHAHRKDPAVLGFNQPEITPEHTPVNHRGRLRTIRRAEPDMSKLVEWVLNITQARWDAYRAGEPDPYGLPMPANLSLMSDARGRVEENEEPELLHPQRRSTA